MIMSIDTIIMGVIMISGLAVGFFGINIYRYAVIIMNAVGGYFLGKIVSSYFLGNLAGEGIFHDMDTSAGGSFILAVFVIAGAALGIFLYQIMGAVAGAVGAGFMFSAGMQVLMGQSTISSLMGWFIGLILGAVLGVLAVNFQRWPMIIFTALVGARIAGYAASHLFSGMGWAEKIAMPVHNVFFTIGTPDTIRMAFFLELFAVLTVIGLIVQALVRDD